MLTLNQNNRNGILEESDFCKRLAPLGRILEEEGYNVWCCSPIYAEDGKVHVFYSRWPVEAGWRGWLTECEVAHAVADKPEGPYETKDVALKGNHDGSWDSWSIHNPSVYKMGDKYVLVYMGNNGAETGFEPRALAEMPHQQSRDYYDKVIVSKRVGMAIAEDLNGPWIRVGSSPLIDVGMLPAWDDVHTSNPALILTPEGKYRIYYKGMDYKSWHETRGNRKFGFAEADRLEGPYIKSEYNPVIDFSTVDPLKQCEDVYIWFEEGKYRLIMRDMGFINHTFGLYLESIDGINWSELQIAYKDASTYFDEPLSGLLREGRFERPQLLMKNGKPEYLYCAYRGGKYQTASAVVMRILS